MVAVCVWPRAGLAASISQCSEAGVAEVAEEEEDVCDGDDAVRVDTAHKNGSGIDTSSCMPDVMRTR